MLLTFPFLACTSSGQDVPPTAATATGPTREGLVEAFRAQRRILYVYGSGDSLAATDYRSLLTEVVGQSRRFQAVVRSDKEVTDAELREWPLYLIGTPGNNTVLKRLLPQLPLNVQNHTVEFNQHQYGDHPVLSLGFYPNPLAPNLPLSLMTGTSERDIVAHVKSKFSGRYGWFAMSGWGYELYDGGRRKVMGFFNESDPKQWTIGGKTHWDFTEDGKQFHERSGIRIFQHQRSFDQSLADSIAIQIRATHRNLASLYGKDIGEFPMEVHLHPTIEWKGLATGNTEPASLGDDGQSLHLVVNAETAGREWPAANLWWLKAAKVAPSWEVLTLGLAVRGTQYWGKFGWAHWAGKLARTGNSLTIREMLDKDLWDHESPYLKACMAAALVDFIHLTQGSQMLRAWCSVEAPAAFLGLIDSEQEFQAHLRNLPANESAKAARPPLPPFHKAFNFAHEGYQIFNGYASTEATVSMGYLQEKLHCNATAVIPYAGYENVNRPSWLEFSGGAGGENDESIIHCLWSAKQNGMATMIKPQVWPWNSWTGEVEMQNEEDWAVFFDHYYRWIRHYAIMGEMYGADLLCIGVEFSKATLQRPDDWRKMIQRLRGIYSGKIVYAANWGEEFEQCKFWDACDYIALNCYYPLTKKDKPSQKDLENGFGEILDKIEAVSKREKKDVLFTEIGFRTVEKTWQNPHAEADDRKPDNAAQAACYKAMIKGLKSRDWCKGVYLWKWPAYMDDAQYDLQGFTPLGRPSEALVEEWFRD